MARNPHWDETINEDEDIGFRGPHFNAPSRSPQQEWGDVGGGGEFSGSRREEVLPSPNMPGSYRGGPEGWGNYRADEFTGIQSNVPSGGGFLRNIFDMFGGSQLGGGFEGNEWKWNEGPWDLLGETPGPWNEFDPPSWEQDRDLMAELSGKQENWMDSPRGTPDFYSNFDDYFDVVTTQEDKGPWWQLGGGAQEPATEQEVINKLNQMMKEKNQRLPWPVV